MSDKSATLGTVHEQGQLAVWDAVPSSGPPEERGVGLSPALDVDNCSFSSVSEEGELAASPPRCSDATVRRKAGCSRPGDAASKQSNVDGTPYAGEGGRFLIVASGVQRQEMLTAPITATSMAAGLGPRDGLVS